ncbi:hypothetical protein BKA69DRAFT_1124283 [Paraphysoderma sedebokerense]|nr:hypothetical protein BKA69DRAFT_1124283 [Paraphysoderma sedebokerense]
MSSSTTTPPPIDLNMSTLQTFISSYYDHFSTNYIYLQELQTLIFEFQKHYVTPLTRLFPFLGQLGQHIWSFVTSVLLTVYSILNGKWDWNYYFSYLPIQSFENVTRLLRRSMFGKSEVWLVVAQLLVLCAVLWLIWSIARTISRIMWLVMTGIVKLSALFGIVALAVWVSLATEAS